MSAGLIAKPGRAGAAAKLVAAPKISANTLIVATIVIATLYFARSILMPVAVAVLLAFILTPMVRLLRRLQLPSSAAVLATVALIFGLLVATGLIVAKQVNVLAENIPRYENSLREKVKTLRGAAMQSVAVTQAAETIKDLGKELSKRTNAGPEFAAPRRAQSTSEKPIPVTVMEPPPTPLETYGSLIATLLEPLTITGLIFLYLTFILLQRQDLRDRFIRLAGQHDIERTTAAMVETGDRLSRFFLLQSVLNMTYGAVVGVALWMIGVPNPALWAGLAFLMRYVPYIGSILAAVFPLILAAAVDPTWNTFLLTLALYVVGESLMGQVVEPVAFGSNTGLSPFAVIVSATLWTTLWGPLGLVLAVPLTLVLVTMSRHIEHLSFLNVMFGDEPALDPTERFYQRALANDPVEAAELAERFVKEESLLTFYDDVALGGLRLAQIDSERGALDERKINVIVSSIAQVSDDLSYVEDSTAVDAKQKPDVEGDNAEAKDYAAIPVLTASDLHPEWRDQNRVVFVSGRSPLDGAAADLLSDLLDIHGIRSVKRSFADFSSSNLRNLDLSGAKIVILSYLSLGKNTTHIRSLIKRVRHACPAAVIVAGVWNNVDRNGASLPDLEIGADHTASSLRTALRLCVDHASREIEPSESAA